MAGIQIPSTYMGVDLAEQIDNPDKKRDCVFMQISEASNSRAIRTERFKYEIRDIAVTDTHTIEQRFILKIIYTI